MKAANGTRPITLWIGRHPNRDDQYAVTLDPAELPGKEPWGTPWYRTEREAIAHARGWLEAKGLRAGKVLVL